ncbi:MAG: ORF6N domain-containing protein, partial [Nitrospirota bacterium]
MPVDVVERKILLIRGHKVMLSTHLAELYGVETRALNQAVKRNIKRFPEDFMFHLNATEAAQLVSQNVIPHKKYFGGSLPYVFTEQGVAMLSSVLNSERAVQGNIAIMRTFVK